MMVLAALLGFLLLGVSTGQEFSCPKDVDLVCLDGYYVDPNDCAKYYYCLDCQFATYTCPDGEHFDEDLNVCRDPYLAECDPVNFPRNGSAFCVYHDGGLVNGPLNPLVFPGWYVNFKAPYDYDTGYWRAAHSGLYYFHLSAGSYPNQKVNVTLAGTPYPFSTVRNSTHHQYDLIARDMLMSLNERSIIAVTLSQDTSIYSDIGKQTMWAGFNIEEFMNNVVAFYAVSNTYQHAIAPDELTLKFEDERIDVGGGYDDFGGIFNAPVDGLYFFFFSSGAEANGEHRSRFRSDRAAEHVSELWRGFGENTGVDTISKSIIYYLDAGQDMRVNLVAGDASNNQSTLLSFGGFLIDPKPPTPLAAWFVSTRVTHVGPEDPLTFESQTLNIGGLFDSSTSQVTITTSGFYYISFYGGLTEENDPLHIELVKQTGATTPVVLADVDRNVAYNRYQDTMGRSLLVHLKADDVIWLTLASLTNVYSDVDKQTTFSGFLLYAIENP